MTPDPADQLAEVAREIVNCDEAAFRELEMLNILDDFDSSEACRLSGKLKAVLARYDATNALREARDEVIRCAVSWYSTVSYQAKLKMDSAVKEMLRAQSLLQNQHQ